MCSHLYKNKIYTYTYTDDLDTSEIGMFTQLIFFPWILSIFQIFVPQMHGLLFSFNFQEIQITFFPKEALVIQSY